MTKLTLIKVTHFPIPVISLSEKRKIAFAKVFSSTFFSNYGMIIFIH